MKSWERSLLGAMVAMALVLGGCGGGRSSTTPKQTTMAEVCASHQEDIGHIAAGLAAFKYAMESGDRTTAAALSSIAESVTGAVSDLRSAAVGAASSNLPAMRHFLELLEDLSTSFTAPPTHPTAVIGNQDVAEVKQAAEQVGCKV
jgi:hypothetical protein